MQVFLRVAAMLCAVAVVLYVTKKMTAHYEMIKLSKLLMLGYYEDPVIYKAAHAFAAGESAENIRQIMSSSYEFDINRIDRTFTLALPHRTDGDGGYVAFIRAVNQVLGEEVYRTGDSRTS